MAELLQRIAPLLTSLPDSPRWLVGYSGGLDSTVLLHLLQRFGQAQGPGKPVPPLLAVHIHHGLSDSADQWEAHCKAFCQHHAIACDSTHIAVDATASGSLEAAARNARYAAIGTIAKAGDLLFLGHHQNDQIETLLLNLLRSRGVAGLAGMATHSHSDPRRIRPLLQTPRTDLLDYARQHQLAWIEDDSNADLRFSRNFVRRRLLPVIGEHWPHYPAQLDALATGLRHDVAVLEEVAAEDLARVGGANRWGDYLHIDRLQELSFARRRNLLAHWLHRRGIPAVRQRQLRAFDDLLNAAEQAAPLLRVSGASLQRYRDKLYIVPDHPPPAGPSTLAWAGQRRVDLGSSGHLELGVGEGVGLDLQRGYQLAFRRGGEVVRGAGWGHSKSLKQYLQEQGIPPWWRARIPLLICDNQLAAVADYCVCEGFANAPDSPAGKLYWHTGSPAQ